MWKSQKGSGKADSEELGGGKMEIQEESQILTCSKEEKEKREKGLELMGLRRERN